MNKRRARVRFFETLLLSIVMVLAAAGSAHAQPAGGGPMGDDFGAPPGIGAPDGMSGAGSQPAGVPLSGGPEGGMPPDAAAPAAVGIGGASTATTPVRPSVMDIAKVEGEENLYTLELRDADLGDLFRVLAHKYKLNILVDKDVKGTVTASLTNISLDEAMDRIAEMHHLIIERKGNVLIVKPDLITRVFVLKHIEAASLLQEGGGQTDQSQGTGTQEAGGSGAPSGGEGGAGPGGGVPSGTEGATAGAAATGDSGTGQGSSTAAGSIYDFLSERGKVFLGRKPNSIMVIDHPDNIAKIEEFLNMVDKGMVSRVFHLKYISPADILHNVQPPQSSSGSQGQSGGGTTPPPPQ